MPEDTYKVGYGKPPLHTRFQKGRSGNPSGARTPRESVSDLLDRIIEEKVEVNEAGATRRMARREVFFRQLVARAIAGDRQHARILSEYLLKRQDAPTATGTYETDQFLLEEISRMMGSKGAEG